jgi:hypothetical protein
VIALISDERIAHARRLLNAHKALSPFGTAKRRVSGGPTTTTLEPLGKVITQGPSADDIVSLYTSFPWPSLCAEVAKLKIELPTAMPITGSGTPPIATPANTNERTIINIAPRSSRRNQQRIPRAM